MSSSDVSSDSTATVTSQIQNDDSNKLKPSHSKFTFKIITLFFSVMMMLGLTSVLFYQFSFKEESENQNQQTPLTKAITQLNLLQKADKLIVDLLIPINAKNFVDLHTELVSINHQLLLQNNEHKKLYKQWLQESKLAEDYVSRIQDSYSSNQQLKNNSIIQLNLMLISLNPVIKKYSESLAEDFKTIEAKQSFNRSAFKNAGEYLGSVQKLNDLKALKSLIDEILIRFESLSMQTSLHKFKSLKALIDEVFVLHKPLLSLENSWTMPDVHKQFDAFEKIVFSEQKLLEKWQGYILLTKKYHNTLRVQQQKIRELLLIPFASAQKNNSDSVIKVFIDKKGIKLSDNNIFDLLVVFFSLVFVFFLFQMWGLRNQFKSYVQQRVESIVPLKVEEDKKEQPSESEQSFQSDKKHKSQEEKYNELTKLYQSEKDLVAQKETKIEALIKDSTQKNTFYHNKITAQLDQEQKNYQYIEHMITPLIHCYQKNNTENNLSADINLITEITRLHQNVEQFTLSTKIKSEKSCLELNDVNLVDEIYALLFNKQCEHQVNTNQLFVSFDEQIVDRVKIDCRLFQQLFELFIDITLFNCKSSQLLLQFQLKDKNPGQQHLNVFAIVESESIVTLPTVITQLTSQQLVNEVFNPQVEMFNVLFQKQYGENIVAQLVDGGYLVSFELPLAYSSTTKVTEKASIENTSIMFLSTNNILANLIEKTVTAAHGNCEHLTDIDTFEDKLTPKYLKLRKVDILIVTSDFVEHHIDCITEKINQLPDTLQPKLMIFQSPQLAYDCFGFYSLTEQLFCKDIFIDNVVQLIENDDKNNKLQPFEPFVANQFISTNLPLLLAVKSPQKFQNLYRLLCWLGFHVKVVANEAIQKSQWETGLYSILVTEFSEHSLVKMLCEPLGPIGVLLLSDFVPQTDNNKRFSHWTIKTLAPDSTITDLADALTPWLKRKPVEKDITDVNLNCDEFIIPSIVFDDIAITKIPDSLIEASHQAVFDFSQYLKHQGSVELALFMMDDYTQDNHHQLDTLIKSIKEKNIENANIAITALTVNANILSAPKLQLLCDKWSRLINGTEVPNSLEKINVLFKETRMILTEIDEYAEAV